MAIDESIGYFDAKLRNGSTNAPANPSITPIWRSDRSHAAGLTLGSTIRFRSSHTPASAIRANHWWRCGFFFVVQFIRPTNGMRKVRKNTTHAQNSNGGLRRSTTYGVSSLRLPYQMGRNCDQYEYTQNRANENR